jgi:hypothetical protein
MTAYEKAERWSRIESRAFQLLHAAKHQDLADLLVILSKINSQEFQRTVNSLKHAAENQLVSEK